MNRVVQLTDVALRSLSIVSIAALMTLLLWPRVGAREAEPLVEPMRAEVASALRLRHATVEALETRGCDGIPENEHWRCVDAVWDALDARGRHLIEFGVPPESLVDWSSVVRAADAALAAPRPRHVEPLDDAAIYDLSGRPERASEMSHFDDVPDKPQRGCIVTRQTTITANRANVRRWRALTMRLPSSPMEVDRAASAIGHRCGRRSLHAAAWSAAQMRAWLRIGSASRVRGFADCVVASMHPIDDNNEESLQEQQWRRAINALLSEAEATIDTMPLTRAAE